MPPGLVASVVCPACGQPFLCHQQAAGGMVTCPHCAHQAHREHFATHGITSSLAPGRRQVYQRPVETGLVMEPPQQQPAIQAWRQPGSAPATSAMQPSLQPPPAPMADGSQDFVPPHLQGSPRKYFLLGAAMLVVMGGGGWVWWDAQLETSPEQSPPAALSSRTEELAPMLSTPETRRNMNPGKAEAIQAARKKVDVTALQGEARVLVEKLFQTSNLAERLESVHEGAQHAAEIEAFFNVPAETKADLTALIAVKGTAVSLPQGEVIPLLNLITSRCAHGALVRLIKSADGRHRIDWPLLRETHDDVLRRHLETKDTEPAWAWVLIKPSHGFELSAKDRPMYLTFALHVAADGRSPLLACAERETPLGRYLERETDWGQAYLCRLFIRPLPIESSEDAVLIVDCEGAASGQTTPP